MSWRERQLFFPNLKQPEPGYEFARFKDAPFFVERYGLDGGRRQAIQKFAGDVYTNVQDLGRDSSIISVRAFLVGEEYDEQLRHLESRLLEGGEGELVLPWRRPFTCTVVGRINTEEQYRQRGYVTVSFDVVETAAPPSLTRRDSAAAVREAVTHAREVTQERFIGKYNTAKAIEARKTTIRTSLDNAATRIVGIQSKVDGFIGIIPEAANTVTRLSGLLNDLINSPNDLSDEIVNSVIVAWDSFRSTTTTAQLSLTTWGSGGPIRVLADQTFRFNSEYTQPVVDTTTIDGQTEDDNNTELNRLCRLNMFYEMGDVMVDVPFESRQQALGLRQQYVDEIDPLLLGATPHEASALAVLVSNTTSFLEEVSSRLPDVGTFTPATTLPSLVIAQIVYGDGRFARDIEIRNQIQQPGFVEQGEPLEVLGA